MADNRLRDQKERLTEAYRNLLDSDSFLEDLGNLRQLGVKDFAPEFLIAIEKLNELYSPKKACRWDSQMVLIDLESFECKNTKTYLRLESDINIMNLGKEDVNQVMKAKQFKSEDKPHRFKLVQKDKVKMKDIQFVMSTYQKVSALPRIALFEELEKCKVKLEEQIDFKKKVDSRLVEFWKKWPKSSFLDCTIKLAATEKANNQMKEILVLYSKALFRCDEAERQLSLIEILLKSTVLRVGKRKASYSVFEKIYEMLQETPAIEDSLLLLDMKKKRDLCEHIKDIETKLKLNEIVSFYDIKEKFMQFKHRCEEIDIKGTEDYVGSVIRKIDPVLSKMKPHISLEELKKISQSLRELPFKLEEQSAIDDRIERAEIFIEKYRNQAVLNQPDILVSEYRLLELRIHSFEIVIKKMEIDKNLISSVLSETISKVDWHKALKLLSKLKNVTMMDQKQSQALILNSCLHFQKLHFVGFVKRRNLCTALESDATILENCHNIAKQKRLEFLKKEKIHNEDLKCITKTLDSILDSTEELIWSPEDWMKEKSEVLGQLLDGQKFLRNLTKDLDLSIDVQPLSNELPPGSYMEDFAPGYPPTPDTDYPIELVKGLLQEIHKNFEKNTIFELGKFSSFMEAEKLYAKIREKHPNPKRFEVYLQRVNHFLWKIRVYKYDTLSSTVKAFQYEAKLILRLAAKSDPTLKKLEIKLKNVKRSKKIFSRGHAYFCRPEKLIKRENVARGKDDLQSGQKPGSLRDVHDDWRGLTAHFKVELEPGIEKSREFDIVFNKLKCKDLGRPPMNVIFSRQLNIREFAEKILNFTSNLTKEMEIGVFSSPRLRSMRKYMVKRGIVYQANLDNCYLYLFWKDQWPDIHGIQYYDQQIKSESEMYCLFVFASPSENSRKRSISHLKKRDSSSIFDLGEDEEMEEDLRIKPRKKTIISKDLEKDVSEDSTPNKVSVVEKATISATAGKVSTAAATINEKTQKDSKKFKELVSQLRILSIQIEEVKNDFDEFQSDYENEPFTQEDMEFYEFAKLFEAMNPEFIYEIGEGDYDNNAGQANEGFFNGGMDQGGIDGIVNMNGDYSRESYYNQNIDLHNFSNFDNNEQFQHKGYGNIHFDNQMYTDDIPYDLGGQQSFRNDNYRRNKNDNFNKNMNMYSGE